MHRSQQPRSGSTLVIITAVIVILMTLMASLADMTVLSSRQQTHERHQVDRLIVAESTANLGFRYLQDNYFGLLAGELAATEDPNDPDVGMVVPLLVAYGIDELNHIGMEAQIIHTAANGDDHVFLIRGTSVRGDTDDLSTYQRHRVEFVVLTVPTPVLSQAMFAIQGYDFIGSAESDSWNSDLGPYDPGTPGWEGDLGSEGTIYVPPVKQDDPLDPFDDPDVKGDIQDQQEFPLPVFDYDEMLTRYPPATDLSGTIIDTAWVNANDSDGDASTNTWYLTGADSPYHVASVDLANKDAVHITGVVRLFVEGAFNVKQTKFVYATPAPSSQLIIYQNDYAGTDETGLTLNGNDYVGYAVDNGDGTMTAVPEGLLFFTEYSGQMSMNGNGLFSGVLFAPSATIKLNGTFDFYGSIIALAFASQTLSGDEQGRVNGTYSFHYDEALEDLDLDLTPRLVLSGWRSFSLGVHAE